MKNIKQLALVGLLSFGIANADISLDVACKNGEVIVANPTIVVKNGEPAALMCDGKTVSITATPTEDGGVSIKVALEDHSDISEKLVQWGEAAEFSCEKSDCCLKVVAEQIEQQ